MTLASPPRTFHTVVAVGYIRPICWSPSPNHQAETVMSESNSQQREGASRRTFLKTTSALVGGAVLGANATIARSAHIGGSDEIKVALIGCGGPRARGPTPRLPTHGQENP